MRPFSVESDSSVPKEPNSTNPLYLPVFSTGPCDSELFHIFVIAFDSEIASRHAPSIRSWRDTHPGTILFILILELLRSSFSFSNQRAKPPKAIASLGRNCQICFARYFIDSSSSPDSDLRLIRKSMQTALGSAFSCQHSLLTAQLQTMDESSPKFAETLSELAHLCRLFGNRHSSACHYRKMMDAQGVPFWPESPRLLDVVLGEPHLYGSSYEIIASALSGILHCQGLSLDDQVADVRTAFGLIFSNSQTSEERLFARVWVRLTALKFAGSLISREHSRRVRHEFGFLALTETPQIWSIQADMKSAFLRQLPASAVEQVDFLKALKKVFPDMQRHLALIRVLRFMAALRSDAAAAAAFLDGTAWDLRDARGRRWVVETRVLERLFAAGGAFRARVAPLLLASTASDALKRDALSALSADARCVAPQVPLRADICVPNFIALHERNEVVAFSVALAMPRFLLGLHVAIALTVARRASGGDVGLETDPRGCVAERRMRIDAEGACRLVGEFRWLRLRIAVGNAALVWAFPLPVPLQVQLSRAPMSFDLRMPSFLAVGATQAAVFIVDHADPTLAELSLEFALPGLREVRYGGRVFRDGERVTIRRICRRMELLLVYEVQRIDDAPVTVVVSMLRESLSRKVEVFQPPPIGKLGIALVNGSSHFQQFVITNGFLARFSFMCDGRKHRIRPNSKYCFIRKGSGPLALDVTEDGWEDFPIVVEADCFEPRIPVVKLDVRDGRWMAGDARAVHADRLGCALPDQNWIVVQPQAPGDLWVLIPKRPGVLKFPDFLIGQQICRTFPPTVRIVQCECPPLIPL